MRPASVPPDGASWPWQDSVQWQAAARQLLDGDSAETVTYAVEPALLYEARLDVTRAKAAHR